MDDTSDDETREAPQSIWASDSWDDKFLDVQGTSKAAKHQYRTVQQEFDAYIADEGDSDSQIEYWQVNSIVLYAE
jgi:hypothetical protein